jgi:hypothetical protein
LIIGRRYSAVHRDGVASSAGRVGSVFGRRRTCRLARRVSKMPLISHDAGVPPGVRAARLACPSASRHGPCTRSRTELVTSSVSDHLAWPPHQSDGRQAAILALRQWPLRSPTDQCIGHVAGTAFQFCRPASAAGYRLGSSVSNSGAPATARPSRAASGGRMTTAVTRAAPVGHGHGAASPTV